MGPIALVEGRIDAGQRFLDRLAAEGVVIRAACWLRPPDDDRWRLYLATPLLDAVGSMDGYGRVLRVLRSLGDGWLTSSDVSLVSESDPLARDVLEVLRQYPGRMPMPSPRSLLGNLPVEEVYIYPPDKVEVTVFGMVYKGEPDGALHLSLEPHRQPSWLEVEAEGKRITYPAETGINWQVAAPSGATLERDEIGRLVLAWDMHGNRVRSSANEVWSLARLGLHGFRFQREPSSTATIEEPVASERG